jgi:NAD(P)-dependent dehydrogenase (short-subunit alcohol dehydrogenase family)
MPPFTVHERRAIITGGANGLGLAFARRLVAEGARVCISDIAVEAGEKAVKDICKQNNIGKNRVCFVKCNVASKEEWYSLWDEAEKQLEGKIEILCNNAGVLQTVSKPVDGMQDLLSLLYVYFTSYYT